ncbi:hypothetical protein ABK040_004707 [Willaertia magna]
MRIETNHQTPINIPTINIPVIDAEDDDLDYNNVKNHPLSAERIILKSQNDDEIPIQYFNKEEEATETKPLRNYYSNLKEEDEERSVRIPTSPKIVTDIELLTFNENQPYYVQNVQQQPHLQQQVLYYNPPYYNSLSPPPPGLMYSYNNNQSPNHHNHQFTMNHFSQPVMMNMTANTVIPSSLSITSNNSNNNNMASKPLIHSSSDWIEPNPTIQPYVTILLNIFVSGLGYLFIGQYKKGLYVIIFNAVMNFVVITLGIVTLTIICLLPWLFYSWLLLVADNYMLAKRLKKGLPVHQGECYYKAVKNADLMNKFIGPLFVTESEDAPEEYKARILEALSNLNRN